MRRVSLCYSIVVVVLLGDRKHIDLFAHVQATLFVVTLSLFVVTLVHFVPTLSSVFALPAMLFLHFFEF